MKDPILLWNEVALEANRVSHTNGRGEQAGPPLSARALAIVHIAIYDAYAGVVNDAANYPRYDPDNPPVPPAPIDPTPENIDAAVAGAAYTTLSELFPSQVPFFDVVLAATGTEGTAAYTFGVTVGDVIFADRAGDPGAGGNYAPSQERGKHRVDPDNPTQGFHAPDYGAQSRGFGITARHELAPPPFDNAEYRSAVADVYGNGIAPQLTGTLPAATNRRTPTETLIGIYWAYDGASGLGTPPRLYNQIIREVAIARKNTPGDNARLFAFVNVAMADAGVLAWDQKYIHNFWRPVVGVREHDTSMGPASMDPGNELVPNSDPNWLPLGAPSTNRPGVKNFTPNFPAYPSGHATFGAAAFHVTRLFYGQGGTLNKKLGPDKLFAGLAFVSEELNGVNVDNNATVRPRHLREFAGGLYDMILENGVSRVFLGVHWVFDAFAVKGPKALPDLTRTVNVGRKKLHIGGVPLGIVIAEDIFGRNKRAPLKSPVGPRTTGMAERGAATYWNLYDPATPKQ